MCKADAKGAFLQGRRLDREVAVEPVPELREAYGLRDDEVLLLTKAVYGLVDAPREWWLCLDAHFQENGWMVIGTEPCTWRLYAGDQLIGLAICHVDDLLISGDEDHPVFQEALASLRKRFKWGTWETESFTQCGLDYIQYPDYHIELNIANAVNRIEPIVVTRGPRRALTEGEKTKCRAALGALQYVATQLMFWLVGEVSLMQGRINHGETELLHEINKLIRYAQETAQVPLKYYPIEGKTNVCAWADGSWAAREDGKSQGALMVCFVSDRFLRGEWDRVSVASFASRKLPRVARSSLAMECQALELAQDEAEYLRASWSWLERPTQPAYSEYTKLAAETAGTVITDSKGLYDSLVRSASSSLGMNDRRTAIAALALKQCLAETNTTVRWVHSEAMVVDAMTKAGSGKARETTLDFATRDMWRLVHDETFTAAKRRAKDLDRLADNPKVEPFAGPPVVPDYTDDDAEQADALTGGQLDLQSWRVFATVGRLLDQVKDLLPPELSFLRNRLPLY